MDIRADAPASDAPHQVAMIFRILIVLAAAHALLVTARPLAPKDRHDVGPNGSSPKAVTWFGLVR